MPGSPDAQAAPGKPKVLAIGLDAPNHELLLAWMAEGRLPHLRQLQQQSLEVTITSSKRYSNEHAWIPTLTGQSRDRWHHWLDQWDAQHYEFNEASIFNWIQAPLFYALGDACRVVAFDLTAPVVEGVNGIQVSGWGTELNECFPQSDPPGLFEELLARYGPDPKLDAAYAITNRLSSQRGVSYAIPSLYQEGELEAFAQSQLRSVERRAGACRDLMRETDWDLFITQFSEVHTAGHLLWHLDQPHPLDITQRGGGVSMLTMYEAVDQAIGQLLQEVDGSVTILFFTVDAIVPDCLENARAVLLPEFLYRWNFPGKAALAEGELGHAPKEPRTDYALHWKHELWSLRTPRGEAELESPSRQEAKGDPMNWCPANWYAPLWPSMRAFALPSVADGYVRLNVRGREAHGMVSPEDYASACAELAKDLSALVNARTGQPMVREIIRVRESPFDDDPKLPPADLIVVFREEAPVDSVESPRVGRIGPVPYFRSGSHQAHGCTLQNLMFVSGPGVAAGHAPGMAQLEDIPATILALLGLEIPAHFDGVPRASRSPAPPA